MKNKGFTLVELLAVIIILALLLGIGMYTVNNVRENAEKNYYVSMEDTLKIAGNDYFNDNREDKPIDDYNFVSLETLEEHEYLDVLKTYDKKENCDKTSGVYIYNTEQGNEYEVCLKCGIHKSEGPYCSGKKTGQIMITGRTNTGAYYNPVLSYTGTPWVNASSVNITFTLMGDDVTATKFEIYNGNTNTKIEDCTSVSANSCTKNISATGSYYVIAYDGSEKVGNRKYFNVKIDNTPPTFEIKDLEGEKDLENKYEYPYNNEIINIHDDNGYKTVTFSLIELDTSSPRINIVNKDATESNLQILENLPSGKYRLSVTVTDYAKNSTTHSVDFIINYIVNMVYFDNTEKRHDMGTIRVYTNGFYDNLLTQVTISGKTNTVDWYDNTNFDGKKYDSSIKVTKTSTHTLYGREQRQVIPESSYPHCNNDNDFTYNASNQELVSAQTGYHVTNNVQTLAGDYIIIAMPDANYTWADNTRTYKIVQCTIKKYPVTVPVEPCQTGLVFNDTDQTLVKQGVITNNKTSFGYTAYNINPLKGKDAGTYNVAFTLWDASNYIWSDNTSTAKNYTCSISKYKIPTPSSPCKTGLVYNDSNQALIKTTYGLTAHFGDENDPSDSYGSKKYFSTDKVGYDFYPSLGHDAGSYPVLFVIHDKVNFEWSDGTQDNKSYTCEIAKYTVTKPTNACQSGLIYNGEDQTLVKQSFIDNNTTTFNDTAYNIDPVTGKDAKDYTVSFTLFDADNYIWSDKTSTAKTFTCKIDRYKTSFGGNPCVPDLVYNGKLQSIVTNDDNNGRMHTIIWHNSSWGEFEYGSGTRWKKDAGDYEITYSLNDNGNFAWPDGSTGDKTYTCTIAKAPITWSTDRTVVYAGYTAKNTALALSMTSEIGDSIPLRLVPTTVKAPNVYHATVNFASNATDDHKKNYYITNPTTTIGFTNAAVTITAESDKKEYDGKELKNNKYSESGTIAANGETLSSVTVTGSQTIPGKSDNVPSKAVIKYGGFITTDYYNVSYKNGELEVVDTTKPTCSLSIDSSGKITATASDNYMLGGQGFSTSYGGETSKTVTDSSGTVTYYVKDSSGNTNTCSITYEKVKQKRTYTCKTYESCATSGCGCQTYNSCEASGCGCKERNSCADSSCGCKERNSCADSSCGCKERNSCADSSCGCKERNSCQDASCGTCYGTCKKASYTGTCKCERGSATVSYDCTASTCTATCTNINPGTYSVGGSCTYDKCVEWNTYTCSCVNDNCTCKTYKSCVNNNCTCKTYKSCVNDNCTCKTYKTCVNDNCTCKTYKTCEDSSCGCKTYKTCENNACGCKTWNTPSSWSDDKNCSDGEASNHKSKTECQFIYRKK